MVAVAARWRQPAWWQRWQLGRCTILVVAAARLEMGRQRGGGSSNGALAAAVWCMLTIILIVTMMMMIDY